MRRAYRLETSAIVLVGLLLSASSSHPHAAAGDFEAAGGVDLAAMQGLDIVVGEDALPSEQYAAEEFRSYFGQATGTQLPIVKATARPARHVFIGPGSAMKATAAGFETGDFGPEDLRIVIRDDNIAIAGGRPRGTLYGVYTFLEDYFGVRFLTADHTHVPKVQSPRVVGPLTRFYHPPLVSRWSYCGENWADPAFATRLRINWGYFVHGLDGASMESIAYGGRLRDPATAPDPRLGGRSPMAPVNHTFSRQIPSRVYGRAHPEYFALRDGKRRASVENDDAWEGTQPCLTNPDVLEIVTQAA